MENLKTSLKKNLSGAKKVVVLGIGSDLRGDDVAGLLVIEELEKHLASLPKLQIINGGTAPENYTGEIRKAKPSHLVIVDSAEMNLPPGSVRLITIEESGGFSFNTHALPIKIMVDFLRKEMQFHAFIIGIQPRSLKFNLSTSGEVKRSAHLVADTIAEMIESL